MKRILIAQLARIERERRMAQENARPRLQLPAPNLPYAQQGPSAFEASALCSVMLGKAYTR